MCWFQALASLEIELWVINSKTKAYLNFAYLKDIMKVLNKMFEQNIEE